MNSIKKAIFILFIFGIILGLAITTGNNKIRKQEGIDKTVEFQEEPPLKYLKTSKYWDNFSFIHIDGNWSTAASYEWCTGDGSWDNPYSIENVTIDASSSPTGSGILINNSKFDYFIIKNCTVYNARTGSEDAGIKLENTNNGTLLGNNCSNNLKNGILLSNTSKNNTISNNEINNNDGDGIRLYEDCDNNTIAGNTVNGNFYDGIEIEYECDNNTIVGNTVNGNNNGIIIQHLCDNNTIAGNTANGNNENGIYLYNSLNNNIFSGNNLSYNKYHGIYLDNFYGHECYNNTISGNNVSHNRGFGIYLDYDWHNGKIEGNIANENGMYGVGIYLNECDNNTITGNTANDHEEGCGIIIAYCENSIISGNTANNNTDGGLFIVSYGYKSKITGNTANGNKYGIYLDNCDDTTISKNTFNDNLYGIYLYRGTINTIAGNIIYNNSQNGAWLGSNTYANLLYFNYFIGNGENARDEGNNNQWDNGLLGNYWDDYSGVDICDDGIGDTPYVIPGMGGGIDNYPIYSLPVLDVDIIDQSFSHKMFNLTFFIHNSRDKGVPSATIQIWWNGTNVSDDLIPLGDGNYSISLEPITILPGENPILLNMTISAENYEDLYYEFYIAVEREVKPEIYLIYIDIIEQKYSEEWFNLTFYISNASNINQGIEGIVWEILWNGTDISGDITPLEGGYYNLLLEPLTILPGENPICLNGTMSAAGFEQKKFEFFIAVEVAVEIKSFIICMDIIEQLYSEYSFNFTFYVYNASNPNQGIEWLEITDWSMWWNGMDVSGDIVSLGGGNYSISLAPITVQPGEDPICLNGTIVATDFEQKNFKFFIAVDPEIVMKQPAPPPPPPSGDGGDGDGAAQEGTLLITLLSIIGTSIVAGFVTVFIAWKKGLFSKFKRK